MIDQSFTPLESETHALLASWTAEHSLTDAERQRILNVLTLPEPSIQRVHETLRNVLARRRFANVQLDRNKLVTIGEAHAEAMRRERAEREASSQQP